MTVPLKFQPDVRSDLATRPDFTFDLMQSVAREAKLAAESASEVTALKSKATVTVSARATLTGVDVSVDVVPSGQDPATPEEIEGARAAASAAVKAAIEGGISKLLQGAIDSARGRM